MMLLMDRRDVFTHTVVSMRRCGVCILYGEHGQFRAPGHFLLSEHYHGPRPAPDHECPRSTGPLNPA